MLTKERHAVKVIWLVPIALLVLVFFSVCDGQPQTNSDPNQRTQHLLPKDPAEREIALLVPPIAKRLERWRAQDPKPGERSLKVVYWSPSDRKPAPAFQRRLTEILEHIGRFYANEMQRVGYGHHGLKFDRNEQGQIKIHEVTGKHPYAHYSRQSGSEIRQECVAPLKGEGIDINKETLVIFCNMANWNQETCRITQNSPYYASGNQKSGTCWQVDSPILNLNDLAEKGNQVDDGQYGKISLGRYNSIFIGGIAHELGHALGLPHNCERFSDGSRFGTALMGAGNRSYGEELRGESKGSFLTVAHATRLASHPMFSGSIKQIDQQAKIELDTTDFSTKGSSVRIAGKVSSDIEVYAAIAYLDPAGRGDYDSFTYLAPVARDGNFELRIDPPPSLEKSSHGEIRLVFQAMNGSANSFANPGGFRFPYRVTKTGEIDLQCVILQQKLKPLMAAVQGKDQVSANEALKALETDPNLTDGLAYAKALVKSLEPRTKLTSPAATAQSIKSLPLSRAAHQELKSGYGRPLFDQMPGASPLICVQGKVHEHALYLHAPSFIRYDLGGNWKQLKGITALAPDCWGKAAFAIKADGKMIWRSKLLSKDSTQAFQVDVSGVKQLELLALEGDGTNRSDWTLWIEPTLTR